jgi:ribonucleoside-diphosphate reductase alpha chain
MSTSDGRETRDPATGPRTEKAAAGERTRSGLSGLTFRRLFTDGVTHPFDSLEWELRTAAITNEKGEVFFEQKDVEVPKTWSMTATNIVAQKYFHGKPGTAQRERSVKQLIGRVVDTITGFGHKNGTFRTAADRDAFSDELTHVLVNQAASFNSPVWFNVGVEPKPQASACFINSVGDSMQSILELAKTEGMLFKFGSGTGSNLSSLRSSTESLSSGGIASGPVSFMKGFDSFAGAIKSGGKTRRAAKMVILNVDHPDIEEFILCKEREEKKAWDLIDSGWDGSFNGEVYSNIAFQNANHSVRVTDEFMRAAEAGGTHTTKAVTSGEPMGTYDAKALLLKMAESAWVCGDPGMQYDTLINKWNPCKATHRINASNPCVTGDTLIATADGWRRIDELVGKTARVVGADGVPHFVTRIFPTGRKPVFRLRTRAGYEVRITGDHKVLTLGCGDVSVAELKLGDRLMLQGPGFGRRALSESLALAVGVAVGDGCLTRSHTTGHTQEIVILTMAREEAGVLQKIAGAVNEVKRTLRVANASGRADDVHVSAVPRSTSRLSFSSKPVVSLFTELAVLDEGSAAKRFTPAAFELDKPSLAGVLRGLFTADGTVGNYGEKSQYVALDSTSRELLRQTQLHLLSFGIKAKIYEGRRGGKTEAVLPDGRGGYAPYPVREVASLRITRSSRVLFEREIGFDAASPKAAALRTLNADFGSYRDELSDEVVSIQPLGEEQVFDLTEETTRHFVANGLIVHNCSEYMFIDDSACNLASLNLMKFAREDGGFEIEKFRHAVDIVFAAQEMLVGEASYPTPAIEKNSHAFRPIGLGYANLGALLMFNGIPYDSDEGRHYAAAVTSLMHGQAFLMSSKIAAEMEPFAGYAPNRDVFLEVISMHRDAAHTVEKSGVPKDLYEAQRAVWDLTLESGRQHGFKNAQATVLAPTGTIGFMMDCDTTGVEPDLALVKYKKLVGGGTIKIVNQTVPNALTRLGYADDVMHAIVQYIDEKGTIEGAPGLKGEHLPVFDCAFKALGGTRSITPMGHVRMMSAVQPFLSGAISKTVNMPNDATVEEIADVYMLGWKLGLKAIAIYRDGCKRTQPLNTAASRNDDAVKGHKGVSAVGASGSASATPSSTLSAAALTPHRHKLPDERRAITHKFSVAGHEGYITVGLYEDGTPGEIFLTMAKEGSTISGLMDSFATAISLTLQYGVPLEALVEKFSHMRFEPAGYTKNPEIPIAKSLVDYLFRWLASKFLTADLKEKAGVISRGEPGPATTPKEFKNLGTLMPLAEAAAGPIAAAFQTIVSASARPEPPAAEGAAEARAIGFAVPVPSYASRLAFENSSDAPSCHECGSLMVRGGACYKCLNCGATSGCS